MAGTIALPFGVSYCPQSGSRTRPHRAPARAEPSTLENMAGRPVRVAILGINYAPEPTGIAPYTTGLAAGLAERGHDVAGLDGFSALSTVEARRGQFRIPVGRRDRRRARSPLSHLCHASLSWVGRAAMELTFGLQLLTTRWGRPEVVVCMTPPLLAAAMSAVRARLTWRRPAIGILVHDLYSRGVAETGAVSGYPRVQYVWWNRRHFGWPTVLR